MELSTVAVQSNAVPISLSDIQTKVYSILRLGQEVYNSLSAHHCNASAFEIAYWQEHQKLSDTLKTNKALALDLEKAQLKIYYYEQTLIPNYRRAEEEAEEYANSLQLRLEAAQQKRSSSTVRQEGEIDKPQAQFEPVVRENTCLSPVECSRRRREASVDEKDISERDIKKRAMGNQTKLRRVARANLTVST